MESGWNPYCTRLDPTCKFPDRSVMGTTVVALRRTSLCLSIPPSDTYAPRYRGVLIHYEHKIHPRIYTTYISRHTKS